MNTATRESELDDFKAKINLIAFASDHFGYTLSKAESSDVYAVLRKNSDNKLVVTKSVTDNHWVYFNVHDRADCGSVIDLIQNRTSLNLGRVRVILRPWVGVASQAKVASFPSVKASSFNREAVLSQFSTMQPIQDIDYLEKRGLQRATIDDPRFRKMIRQDDRKNVIFPHYDPEGVTGYEVKNDGYSGFAKHGRRALWSSQCSRGDEQAIFFESAIDALSHFQLKPNGKTRYHSLGGSIGGQQQPLLKQVLLKCQDQGINVVTAFDNDDSGHRYHELICELSGTTVDREVPEGDDWNEMIDRR